MSSHGSILSLAFRILAENCSTVQLRFRSQLPVCRLIGHVSGYPVYQDFASPGAAFSEFHRQVKYNAAPITNTNTTSAPTKSNKRPAVCASPFGHAGLFKKISRAAKNATDMPSAWTERIAVIACGEPRTLIGPSRLSKAAVKKPPTTTRSFP